MLALVGRPSLHGYYACMVYWTNGAHRRNCGQKQRVTSFSPLWVFLFSRTSGERFWGLVLWYIWIGRTRHPGPTSLPRHVGVEFLNVGGWLTHEDLALEVGVDFLAVVEYRLIPARVASEWSRHKGQGLASFWAPVCQGSSHVGNAGVCVIMRSGGQVHASSWLWEGSCIWLSCTVITVPILMLSSLL